MTSSPVNVSFRLACGCTWRLGRGGPLPAYEVLHPGDDRQCWRGHGPQTVVRVTLVLVQK